MTLDNPGSSALSRSFQPTDLEYFIEICRLGSIAQAAIQLGVSQPALSKAVRRLEHIAGAKLLDRTARGVTATEMGQILLQRANVILFELNDARSALQELSGVRSGSVTVGVAPTLNHSFIPDIIELALNQRPRLQLRVAEGLFQSLLPRLQSGELDFIISSPSMAEAQSPDVQCEVLGSNLFVPCVSANHPLLKLKNIDGPSMLSYRWVLVPAPGVLREHLSKVFRKQGLTPVEPHVETSSTVLSKALIMRQGFVGFLPLEVFAIEEEVGLIRRLDVPWLRWQRELTLMVRRSRTLTPAAQYAIDLIRSEAKARLDHASSSNES